MVRVLSLMRLSHPHGQRRDKIIDKSKAVPFANDFNFAKSPMSYASTSASIRSCSSHQEFS